MEKKYRKSIQELISGNKDYSKLTEDELINQYNIIVDLYDAFKIKIIDNSPEIPQSNISIIKIKQKRVQQNMYSNIVKEIESHLKIMKDTLDSM